MPFDIDLLAFFLSPVLGIGFLLVGIALERVLAPTKDRQQDPRNNAGF